VPTIKEISRRILSISSTRKITKAMKLVAGARLRRAQEMIVAARPYASKMHTVIDSLARRAETAGHPLLATHERPRTVLAVSITSDRGLCGAFSRKGNDYFARRGLVERYFADVFLRLDLERAREIGNWIIARYTEGDLDEVVLIYNEFKSALTQKVVVERLLPLATSVEREAEGGVDYIYEPGTRLLLDALIPRYVHTIIYRALLESWASEMGARMTAMENATRNAGELIDSLTLTRNRVRQATITKELVEITSGAEALKG
jgi:F-type H+-transporting ATPase subunit gamma